MSSSPTPSPATSWSRLAALVVGLTALLTLLAVTFSWPATQLAPRGLPIVVAGPPAAASQVTTALERAVPGGFAVTSVGDEAAAREALTRRDAYGAVLVGAAPTVLTASAASPVVAQVLTQVSAGLAAAPPAAAGLTPTPPAVRVVDVVPAPASDPRGAGLAALALPLVLGGLAVGAAFTRATHGLGRRVAAISATSAAVSGSLAGVAHGCLGILTGNVWAEAGVIALGIAAVSLMLAGLEAVLGLAGLAIGAAVVMLLGNPLSGMTSAPQMLPTGWGRLGQLLPPGATGTALRSVAYFDGAAAAGPLAILASWVALGLVLAALGTRHKAPLGRHEEAPTSNPTTRYAASRP